MFIKNQGIKSSRDFLKFFMNQAQISAFFLFHNSPTIDLTHTEFKNCRQLKLLKHFKRL